MRLKLIGIMTLNLLIFVGAGLLPSCNSCENYACFTPPESFYFQIENNTGKTLLDEENFDLSAIDIVNTTAEKALQPKIFMLDSVSFVSADLIGWEEGENTYVFTYQDKPLFKVLINAREISEDCCTFTRYDEVLISDANAEKNQYVYSDKAYIIITNF